MKSIALMQDFNRQMTNTLQLDILNVSVADFSATIQNFPVRFCFDFVAYLTECFYEKPVSACPILS
jgi:hypothetical protein